MIAAPSWLAPWVPPAVSRWGARRAAGRIVFTEFDGSWAEAERSVSGYDDASILERVADATRLVESGAAAYERDGVLFGEPRLNWPVLAALSTQAARDGYLRVLDFGGSLGSTYRQNRLFLERLPNLSWSVVEQPAFVERGHQEFSNAALSFSPSISASVLEQPPNAVLLASTLEYLADPYSVLAELAGSPARTLVIERSSMADVTRDILCIQTVPESIYPARYPMWVLSRTKLLDALSGDWLLVSQFPSAQGGSATLGGQPFEWSGLIFTRN